jgi:hypothetical protein
MTRPITLTIAVVLQWVAGFIMLLAGFDLFMSALRLSDAATESALDNTTKLQGITDISAAQVVSGVLMAGILLIAIAILRVILAVYLGRGRQWARTLITVLVVLNMLASLAYIFQDEIWRGLPSLVGEVVILWLLFNARSSAYISAQSKPEAASATV